MNNRFLTFVFLILLAACSKKKDDVPDNDLTNTPTAKVQYDNSNYGVYKGVFTGSSGVIIININNDGAISATLKVGGVTYNFTTAQTIQQGQETTVNFVSGSSAFTFTVSPNGANPLITDLAINGHPHAAILVVKETSTAIVKCYEGKYSGDEAGIFNAIIYNNTIKGLIKNSANVSYVATGTVLNNQINSTVGSVTGGATFKGTVSGNNASGTWSNTAANWSGSWSGTRTY